MINSREGQVQLMSPPNTLSPVPEGVSWSDLRPNYLLHHAYKISDERSGWVLKLNALSSFFKSVPKLFAKRLVQYERIPSNARKPRSFYDFQLLAYFMFLNIFRVKRSMPRSEKGARISAQLDKFGCCVLKLDDCAIRKIKEAAEPEFHALVKKRCGSSGESRSFEESRGSAAPNSKLYNVTSSVLRDAGVIDAASLYLKKRCTVADVNPQINDATDDFWNRVFDDIEDMTLSSSAYFHRDASGGDVKAILYMSDVAEEHGPFTYALGSHKMKVGKFDDFVMEANDSNSLGATNVEARRLFAALPRAFQQKGSFGNDLTENDELSNLLSHAGWEICGPTGLLIVFDTKGVHRGGMVRESSRKSLPQS